MTGAGRLMPRAMWDHRVVHAAMGCAAAPVQGAARVPLAGTAPEGQSFKANPRRIRSIADSPAVVDEVDVGPPGPLLEQTRLGDCWLPRRGIFSVGETSVENFDQGCHRLPIPDQDCFDGILGQARPPAAPGTSQPGSAGQTRPRCAAGAPNGPPPGCLTSSSKKPSPATTRSSAWNCPRSPSTAARTKPRAVVKGPLQAVADRGLLLGIETLHLDRGYDSFLTTERCQALGLTDIVCAKKKPKSEAKIKTAPPRTGLAR
jgi:hypothetical protein